MAYIGFMTLSVADYDNEVGNIRVRVAAITAANHDAQVTLHDSLVTAIDGICNGLKIKRTYGNENVLAVGPDSNTGTQRELKWLVSYHDSSTLRRYSLELPCADVGQLDPNDRAHAEIGDAGVVDAFITAFEAVAKSPVGNAVTVDEITLVGRPV